MYMQVRMREVDYGALMEMEWKRDAWRIDCARGAYDIDKNVLRVYFG